MSGAHHHNCSQSYKNTSRLLIAIVINLLLSFVQLLAGLISGSLSLVADAVHNFGDVGSLVIAYAAQKMSGWSSNNQMTYGYGRAEVIGAFVNSLLLIGTSIFLFFEAFERFFSAKQIDGFLVVAVGFLAFTIDLCTSLLTYKGSKESLNMRAAFLHNLSDALASVGVIASGFFAMYLNIYWVDSIATFGISLFILYHSYPLLKTCFRILMQATPDNINILDVKNMLLEHDRVEGVLNLHVWQIRDKSLVLEAKVSVNAISFEEAETLKNLIKDKLEKNFQISQSTIEFSVH